MSKVSLNLPRFSWEKGRDIVSYLAGHITGTKMFFGGSFCRLSVQCGDIDLAILKNADTLASISQLEFGHGVKLLSAGQKQRRTILDIYDLQFQLDVWFIEDVGQWGPLCMFVAGNGNLNIRQRIQAVKQGYSLSQYDVTKDGVSCGPFLTEQSVYSFMNWKWIPYPKRTV